MDVWNNNNLPTRYGSPERRVRTNGGCVKAPERRKAIKKTGKGLSEMTCRLFRGKPVRINQVYTGKDRDKGELRFTPADYVCHDDRLYFLQ